MQMRDIDSKLAFVYGVNKTITTAGGAEEVEIDRQGFEALELSVSFGASGDTLSGAVYWTVKLEHSDDDGSGSAAAYSDVAEKDVLGATPASGIVVTVDAAAEDEAQYNLGYIGGKRHVKATVTPVGTHTNGTPISVIAVKALGHAQPVA